MKKITLNILAQDILETKYHNQHDCAVTRALKRAGVKARDIGRFFVLDHTTQEDINKGRFERIINPDELGNKVISMYNHKDTSETDRIRCAWMKYLKPADFSFEIEVPESWL